MSTIINEDMMGYKINSIFIISQIFVYVLGIILIIQLLKLIFGGSWRVEDFILALLVANITLTFGLGGYIISINNKTSQVDKKLHGHLEWQKAKNS